MSKNLQRSFFLFAALCFLGLNGVHVALVQVYGWATMFARYSEQMPIRDALTYTFDGNQSCGYCAFVETAKENNWQADQYRLQKEVRLLPIEAPASVQSTPPPSRGLRPARQPSLNERMDAPPGPPPRLA